ncbi:sensor histidine kinase [Formosa algae]|uniref:LytS/YehU family sensor histidine kinase n=2 Tax=Formosa algae TaxID=225843 RepID=A0A9X0YML7_9FLAO|nr:sensor histidine kinase [Formosa algae]MBP1840059.1 LytS/YehU family sensor histidine kinase [Formosa algae]MDQ0335659.1 LytS/YehU family sensor histidine kinase [Formosa algae]OEI78705.1 histidine kinase [Formosa algae]PNW29664.1 sensor histidine kinase [Formosa algae]
MQFISNHLYKVSLKHHILFWLLYFSLNTLRWGSYFNDTSFDGILLSPYLYSLKTNLLGFPIHMILCYLNIYVLMPKFAFKKNYVMYLILLLSSIFVMVCLKFNLTYFLVSQSVWPEGPEIISNLTLNYTVDMMFGELYVITFVTSIKITLDFLKEHKRVTDLEKAQLETELLFLKTQISPHFFFNTLNNIYSLAVENSKKTPKIILKLAELMRYMLYETKNKRQSLENEILCIQNYLDLERVRLNDNVEIDMSISGDIEDKEISPILLLTFIENAFKHGVHKNIGDVKIEIDLSIKEDFLYFRISNPMPLKTEHKERFDRSSGIGLENVKKRLALGYHKNDYKLKIKATKDKFTVKLKIKVS